VASILVVDDEPDVRELFNITLKMAGHVTDTAKDGVEAVNKLADGIPDLILLDLMMPRLDGFGLLDHIRKNMDNKPVRVLVATAKVLEDADHQKLSTWPVVGVLNKGELDIGQMVSIVSNALSRNPLKNGDGKGDDSKKDESKKDESKKDESKKDESKPG
jgi:CheY-like chemotaxis protein